MKQSCIWRKVILCASVLTSSASLYAAPDIQTEGTDAVKSWAWQRISAANTEFNDASLSRQPSAGFWGSEIVYQIQVDRFNNGDTSNDNVNIQGQQNDNQDSNDLYGLQGYREGGDLQGVIDRLDYIKDLGATALWLTPIFKHDGSYHGYCTADLTQIDPGFGSNELLREMVSQAHQRGIKVILDVVVNHMCDNSAYYSKQPSHYDCANDLSAKNWNGASGGSSAQGELNFSDEFFGPFKNQNFFNRCGANSQQDMQGTEPVAIYGDFVSTMFDYDTRNHDFQDIFTNLHKYWIAYADVDGFRLDAAKHVTEDFVAYFSTEVRDYAQSIGKDNFYIVGEVAGPEDWIGRRLGNMYTNPTNPDQHGSVPVTLTNRLWDIKETYLAHGKVNFPGMNAAFDFAHGGNARDALLNKKGINAIEDYFTSDYYSTLAAQADERINFNILEIHDWPRFIADAPSNNWKSKLGLGYLMTAQGIPVIYYGQEQGFNGKCNQDNINAGGATGDMQGVCSGHDHALFRQDMFVSGRWRLGSSVDEIDDLAYIGHSELQASEDWTTDPYLNREHDVYKSARKFAYIRQSCDALRYGNTTFRWSDQSDNGLSVFSRISGTKEALVVVNNASWNIALSSFAVNDMRNGIKYRNLAEANQVAWTGGDGRLYFNNMQMPGNTVSVFVEDANVSAWSDYLETYQCNDYPQWPVGPGVNKKPIADAGSDISINMGEAANFSASASSDIDGEITAYEWSNGLSGETASLTYATADTFVVTLTVTDNEGAQSTDTVTVTVKDPNVKASNFEQLYFRGTPNGWGTTAMVLVDDYTWQLEVSFADEDNPRFKLDRNGDWSLNYGDDGANGSLEQSGDNILVVGNTTYLVTVNDQNRTYSVEEVSSLDTDGDGVGDDEDAFPLDPTETLDSDLDGIGNNQDLDDDNDGIADTADAFPLNAAESIDSDLDGTGNNADLDDDNDGYSDLAEQSAGSDPLNASSLPLDTDGDFIPNATDLDDDNDGVADTQDAFPLDASESLDSDGDLMGNNSDLDDDNDSYTDIEELAAGSDPLDAASIPQLVTTVDVSFTCKNATTYVGQNVYVVGNLPELGAWNSANAVKLGAANYPNWSASITLPANTAVKWKCIKKEGSNVQWQSGGNNTYTTPATGTGTTSDYF